uniref:Uncharacterized protein n=1 Tax=Sphaerodactylus townsendi TaxID=933632 RepID=A0ACB8EG00_9SAUR
MLTLVHQLHLEDCYSFKTPPFEPMAVASPTMRTRSYSEPGASRNTDEKEDPRVLPFLWQFSFEKGRANQEETKGQLEDGIAVDAPERTDLVWKPCWSTAAITDATSYLLLSKLN